MATKYLFIDRDGTLIKEPADQQVDALHKLELLDHVIPSLIALQEAGYRLVMVTNQDGLGSSAYPKAAFDVVERHLEQILGSQGIRFEAVLVCPHLASDHCLCRKPGLGLVRSYLSNGMDRARSLVIGDRQTDLELAGNMGLRGVRIGQAPFLGWAEITRHLLSQARKAQVSRSTQETSIEVTLDLDGRGQFEVSTGIGYFDHMLEQLAKHGGWDLKICAKGDLRVDEHHTVEDVALTLGQAFRRALGDKVGIARYGFVLPMDEAEAQISLDLSGRPYLVFEGKFEREYVGELPTELIPHFYRSFADAAALTLHVRVKGDNTHHMVESTFKALGRALRSAAAGTGKGELPTTKGLL